MYGIEVESAYASARRGNSIECNVMRVDRGWRVEVLLPRRVSGSDAQKMLQWLEDYRSEIRRQHSYWLHRIRTTDRGYVLDVEPAESPRDVIAKAIPFLQCQQQQDLAVADGDARADRPATRRARSSENGTDMARTLPAAPPTPRTRSEIQFNQLNIQQIPPSTLDGLSPDQVLAFHQSTLDHLESVDSRRCENAMAHMEKEGAAEKRKAWIGGLLGIASLGAACVLAVHGHVEVATSVVASLATVIAVVVGSKLVQ